MDESIFRTICPQCKHVLNSNWAYNNDNDNVMIYLKLLSEKCPKRTAM